MIRFVVIGITDNPEPWFPPGVLEIIKQGKVFSGGKRHHEIVSSLLPPDARWIDITVPLDAVFEQYSAISEHDDAHFANCKSNHTFQISCVPSVASEQSSSANFKLQNIIVFASGDPLFFGFANTIRRKMPDAEIAVYPAFNSLQMLAHRLVMPYHDMRIVSLTGRPWPEFDKALIQGAAKIGVLTDKEHTPAAIAQRMLDYGYTYYNIYIGEHLGHPALEKVSALTLEQAAQRDFSMPNCVLLSNTGDGSSLFDNTPAQKDQTEKNRPQCLKFGIPDSEFALLDGREKMITKMPIRLLTLQALDLPQRQVFWDIGFCTGSVSIEARLQFPYLQIEAFEIRPECEAIIQENARRFGAPGIDIHMGDFLETDFSQLPRPDAVFIGGHGGHLKAIIGKVLTVLADDGIIVFNSVTSQVVTQMTDRPSSRQLWDEACQSLDLQQTAPLSIQLNDYNPIEILSAKKRK